jgi:hypothetical protein
VLGVKLEKYSSKRRCIGRKKNRGEEPIGDIIHVYMEMSQGNSLCSCLKEAQKISFFFFFLLQNWRTEGKTRPCLGIGTSGMGEGIRKGCRMVNMVEYYVLMYENGK